MVCLNFRTANLPCSQVLLPDEIPQPVSFVEMKSSLLGRKNVSKLFLNVKKIIWATISVIPSRESEKIEFQYKRHVLFNEIRFFRISDSG